MPGSRVDQTDQVGQATADQGLSPRDPHLGDADLGGRLHEEDHLLVGEHLLVRLEGHTFRGHAVDTAEIAAVGDRQTKIVDGLSGRWIHGLMPSCSPHGSLYSAEYTPFDQVCEVVEIVQSELRDGVVREASGRS